MHPFFSMTGRSPDEHHRASTPLELLFDLVFVVAIALAAAQLHHGFIAHHALGATLSFVMVFFAIWWAWMGFTWFASAFDTDDVPYRLLVMVQMLGALVIAAGIPDAFEFNWLKVTVGYSIMRIGLVALWLRVAYSLPVGSPVRNSVLRQVIGVVACQFLWIGLLFVPNFAIWMFFCMVVAELLVPVWARAGQTPWHAGHIAERYGLLTIIVLGESILSVSMALQAANNLSAQGWQISAFVLCGVIILFTLWWLYFHEPAHALLRKNNTIAYLWGYGHYVIFTSAAAVGAALAAHVDVLTGKAELDSINQGLILAIPLACYLLGLWYCHERHRTNSLTQTLAYPGAAALILLSSLLPHTIFWSTLILVTLLVWRLRAGSTPEA